MRGIISWGAYLPYRRLDRSSISAFLGQGGGRGTRTVASFDEDTTTMGVEAARLALRSWARAQQLEPALGSRITAKSTRVREAVAPPSPDARSGALRPASPGSATLPNARP